VVAQSRSSMPLGCEAVYRARGSKPPCRCFGMDPSAANLENQKIVKKSSALDVMMSMIFFVDKIKKSKILHVIIVIALILVTQSHVLFYIELKYLIAVNLKHEMHRCMK
jgi:hypothetical protein